MNELHVKVRWSNIGGSLGGCFVLRFCFFFVVVLVGWLLFCCGVICLGFLGGFFFTFRLVEVVDCFANWARWI